MGMRMWMWLAAVGCIGTDPIGADSNDAGPNNVDAEQTERSGAAQARLDPAPGAGPGRADDLPPELFVPGLVVTADLAPGHVIVAGDLVLASVPDFAPDPPTDADLLLGATVREQMYGGEPVRLERLVPRSDPGAPSGWAALTRQGERPLELVIPAFAAIGLEAGCPVEVLRGGEAERYPRHALHDALRVLGTERIDAERTKVVVSSRSGVDGPTTIVALPLDEFGTLPPENDGQITFSPPERPGPLIAVARRTLAPGVMIRSEDLGEVGGAGLDGLRYAVAWAQTPSQPIYAGELPHPARLAAAGRGLCTTIPQGMRAVGVPAADHVPPEWVEGHVRVRVKGNEIDHLYVGAVDEQERVVTVFALPEQAWAIAVAASAVGERFVVTESTAL
jgi:hypothetical protein